MNYFYVGNYADWIDQQWIDYLQNKNGDLLPKNLKITGEQSFIEDKNYDLIFQNWDSNRVSVIGFSKHNFPFDINTPFDIKNKIFKWHFIKLKSGMMIPLRPKQNTTKEIKPTIKYRMCLQDYKEGHVFIIDGQVITDYKKGDMFRVNNFCNNTGVVNIINDTCLMYELIVEE